MAHPITYLHHPLKTVNAREADRRRIAEAMAAFGPIEPAPELHTKPTPAQQRVARYQLHLR